MDAVGDMGGFIFAMFLLVLFIGAMRLIGAWMLRINEVIGELKKIAVLLEKQKSE